MTGGFHIHAQIPRKPSAHGTHIIPRSVRYWREPQGPLVPPAVEEERKLEWGKERKKGRVSWEKAGLCEDYGPHLRDGWPVCEPWPWLCERICEVPSGALAVSPGCHWSQGECVDLAII